MNDYVPSLENILFNDIKLMEDGILYKTVFPIFIIGWANNKFVSKVIKKIGRQELSHASISFSHKLDKLYSISSKSIIGKIDIRIESLYEEAFISNQYFKIGLIFVDKTQYEKIKNALYELMNHGETQYSYGGLVKYLFKVKTDVNNVELDRKFKWYCSEMVAFLLSAVAPKEFNNIAMSPDDLIGSEYITTFKEKFTINNFNSSKLLKKVKDTWSNLSSDKFSKAIENFTKPSKKDIKEQNKSKNFNKIIDKVDWRRMHILYQKLFEDVDKLNIFKFIEIALRDAEMKGKLSSSSTSTDIYNYIIQEFNKLKSTIGNGKLKFINRNRWQIIYIDDKNNKQTYLYSELAPSIDSCIYFGEDFMDISIEERLNRFKYAFESVLKSQQYK